MREVERISAIPLLLRFECCSPFLGIGFFQLQAKADAVAEPILAEAVAPAAAEERPEGEDRQTGETIAPPSGEDGRRRAADEAPMLEDHKAAASSRSAAGEV